MKLISALAGGLAGAFAVTLINEFIAKNDEEPARPAQPEMESATQFPASPELKEPNEGSLFKSGMIGDIVSNLFYYSMAGIGKKNVWVKGFLLGLAAGLGTIALPQPPALDGETIPKTIKTKMITVGYYLIGGLISSLAMALLEGKKKQKSIS